MITCEVYTPSGKKLVLETEIVSIGATDGRRGILPNHMPIVLTIEASRFTTLKNGVRTHYAVGDGVLYFKDNVAKILVESIEEQSQIDADRARRARDRANARLQSHDPNIDVRRAEIALKKSLNRLSVYEYRE
ncbi:MAG: F0F1 ATP synthase subunit epsilon [Erysipelotrichaceae bacterium]|nr:F0F1 ATP synthase subunit epsilon [Erysipelotrichaceae bacterium]